LSLISGTCNLCLFTPSKACLDLSEIHSSLTSSCTLGNTLNISLPLESTCTAGIIGSNVSIV